MEDFRDYCVIRTSVENRIEEGVVIKTYDAHRMAMTFVLVMYGVVDVDVSMTNPGYTSKTFPMYFEMLGSMAN